MEVVAVVCLFCYALGASQCGYENHSELGAKYVPEQDHKYHPIMDTT